MSGRDTGPAGVVRSFWCPTFPAMVSGASAPVVRALAEPVTVQVDVTVCPTCGGRMQRPTVSIIAALTAGASVRGYLEGVGLPSRVPPIAPARIDRQLEFDEAA